MKILVTGANGQLGSELQKLSNLHRNWVFIFTDYEQLDITNNHALQEYCKKEQPDVIINCAAYTAVDKAESDYHSALQINGTAVENIVNACKISNSILIHISTDYVFDGTKANAYTENDPTNPTSAYGKSKLIGEQNALKYNKAIIIRTAWLYSATGSNFVKTMIRLSKERKEINVVADQIGSPTYAADLANAILQIITEINNKTSKTLFGIYHFTNAGECSWYNFAQEIMKQINSKCEIKPITTAEYVSPAKRPQFSVLNTKKIQADYNINIAEWKISLNKCLQLININLNED